MWQDFKHPREPANAYTHLLGMLLAVMATGLLIDAAAGRTLHMIAFGIFGFSLIVLYLASSLYHALRASEQIILLFRRLDHVMIFIFIAGSYTPVCLKKKKNTWGTALLIAIWSVAVLGIVIKIFWLHAPRWLYVAIYLAAGWLAVIAIVPIVRALPFSGLLWLLAGGAFYTGGAILYALKWPNPLPGRFGFHEIWHLCVLAGSACHFFLMWQYIAPMP